MSKATTLFWRPLPWLEIRQSHEMRSHFLPHCHPDLSLGLIDRGETLLRLGERSERLRAGQAVLIPPGLAHACNPDPDQPWSNRMLFLAPAALESWGLSDTGEAQVLSDPGLCRRLSERVRRLCTARAAPADLDGLRRELLDLQGSRRPARTPPRWLAPIKERLLDDGSASLATLARQAGLSRWQLIRAFDAATGLTPHAWRLDQRVQRARALLREGRLSLSEIALATGFADQSHFSRSFKARTSVTPGQYRD